MAYAEKGEGKLPKTRGVDFAASGCVGCGAAGELD